MERTEALRCEAHPRSSSWSDLSQLSASLQSILSNSPPASGHSSLPSSVSPPRLMRARSATHDGRQHSSLPVGRLSRSNSYRSESSGSPPGLGPIVESLTPPEKLPRPRLRRNVTFSHMPADLFESEIVEKDDELERGGEMHHRLREHMGATSSPPRSPQVVRIKRRSNSASAVRSAFPRSVFDTHDIDPSVSVPDFSVDDATDEESSVIETAGKPPTPAEEMQAQWQQMQAQYYQQWMYWMQMQQHQYMQQAAALAARGVGVPPPPPPMMMPPMPPPGMAAMADFSLHGGYAVPPPQPLYEDGHQSSRDTRRGGHRHQRTAPVRRSNNRSSSARPETTSDQACALLEEHKVTGRWPTIDELIGHVAEFAADAQGSRYVQHRMEAALPGEKQILIGELLPKVASLADDAYGNYVVQNFLEHGSERQRAAIARSLSGSIRSLSLQSHGCRVVQRTLELVDPASRQSVIQELLGLDERNIEAADACAGGNNSEANGAGTARDFIVYARHPSGTHVLQKAAIVLQRAAADGEDESFGRCRALLASMEDALAALRDSELLELSCHSHAYRVVQKVLGNCDRTRSTSAARIVGIVESSTATLAYDQHGNFILQHILDAGSAEQAGVVQDFVVSHARSLCCHKFASHLVEKCLTTSSATIPQKTALVRELIHSKKSGGQSSEDSLLAMMQDPYANFVVQRAFDETRGSAVHAELVTEIRARSTALSQFTFGRHILQHITSPASGSTSCNNGHRRGNGRRGHVGRVHAHHGGIYVN